MPAQAEVSKRKRAVIVAAGVIDVPVQIGDVKRLVSIHCCIDILSSGDGFAPRSMES